MAKAFLLANGANAVASLLLLTACGGGGDAPTSSSGLTNSDTNIAGGAVPGLPTAEASNATSTGGGTTNSSGNETSSTGFGNGDTSSTALVMNNGCTENSGNAPLQKYSRGDVHVDSGSNPLRFSFDKQRTFCLKGIARGQYFVSSDSYGPELTDAFIAMNANGYSGSLTMTARPATVRAPLPTISWTLDTENGPGKSNYQRILGSGIGGTALFWGIHFNESIAPGACLYHGLFQYDVIYTLGSEVSPPAFNYSYIGGYQTEATSVPTSGTKYYGFDVSVIARKNVPTALSPFVRPFGQLFLQVDFATKRAVGSWRRALDQNGKYVYHGTASGTVTGTTVKLDFAKPFDIGTDIPFSGSAVELSFYGPKGEELAGRITNIKIDGVTEKGVGFASGCAIPNIPTDTPRGVQ